MKCVLVVVFLAVAVSFSFRAPASAADAPSSKQAGESAELDSLRAKAQGGDSLAQFNLGMAYVEGRNTAVDRVEALVWLTLAAEGGTTGNELGNLLVSLDGEQIKAAGRRLDAIRTSSPAVRKIPAPDASSSSARAGNPAPIIAVPSSSTPPNAPQIIRVVKSPANQPTPERATAAPAVVEERGESILSADAAKWDAERRKLSARNDALARELNEARAQLSTLRAAGGPSGTKAADTDARAKEILALEKSLADTREELTAAKTALAIADAQAKAAKSPPAPAHSDSELTSLRRQVRILERDLESATAALQRIAADKTAAETALAAANQRLAQFAPEGQSVRPQSASPARQTSASADARLAQLQSELNEAKVRMADARKAIAARDEELVTLRAAGAAAATRQPAPERDGEVARRTADEALQRLANVTRELADARHQLDTARPLESRLRALEAEKAALLSRATTQGISKEDFDRVVAARADFEQKLSTALQSYTQVIRERDELRAQAFSARELESRVRQLEAEKASLQQSNGDTASSKTEFAQIVAARADAESKLSTVLRSYTLLTKERDELRARVADLSKKASATGGEQK